MQKLDNEHQISIKGGAVRWGVYLGIGAALSFVIGVVDGWINPKKCN